MSSFICIGDLHFKKDNTKITEDILNYCLDEINIKNKKSKIIILLGDILHTHDKIDMFCFLRSISFIERLSNVYKKVVIIIGNHDRPNNKVFCEKDIHPFSSLKYNKKILIADEPIIIKEGNLNLLFVPYVEDGRFEECIKDIYIKNIDMIFAHQNFKGAKFNNFIESNCHEEYPKHFPFCVSGHIHFEQYLNNNLFYTNQQTVYEISYKTKKILSKSNIEKNLTIKKEKLKKENFEEKIKEIKILNFIELIKESINKNFSSKEEKYINQLLFD